MRALQRRRLYRICVKNTCPTDADMPKVRSQSPAFAENATWLQLLGSGPTPIGVDFQMENGRYSETA
jgi:hypothetical protein